MVIPWLAASCCRCTEIQIVPTFLIAETSSEMAEDDVYAGRNAHDKVA